MSMNALKKSVAAAAVGLAFAATSAQAVEVWSITDAFSGSGFVVKSYAIDGMLAAGPYVGSIADVSSSPLSNFSSLGIAIFQTGSAGAALETLFVNSPIANQSYGFDFDVVSPGSYTAVVFGAPGSNGLIPNVSAFSASISLVPEPEAWAMMAVGLGLLGWQLRRKVRSTEASRLV